MCKHLPKYLQPLTWYRTCLQNHFADTHTCWKEYQLSLLWLVMSVGYTIPHRATVSSICHEQRWGQLRWPTAHAVPEWEGRVGSVSRCSWCGAATATFLQAVHVCSVCKGERGEIEGLVHIILHELGLYIWFLWGRALLMVPEPALSVIPMLAHTSLTHGEHWKHGPS